MKQHSNGKPPVGTTTHPKQRVRRGSSVTRNVAPRKYVAFADRTSPDNGGKKLYEAPMALIGSGRGSAFQKMLEGSTSQQHHAARILDLRIYCEETFEILEALTDEFLEGREKRNEVIRAFNAANVDTAIRLAVDEWRKKRQVLEKHIEESWTAYMDSQQPASFWVGTQLLPYDPSNPKASLTAVIQPLSPEATSSALAVPFDSNEPPKKLRLLSHAAKAWVSVLVGGGLLGAAGLLHPASFEHDPLTRQILACGIGFAGVYLSSELLRMAFRNARDSILLNEELPSRKRKLAIAWLVVLAVIAIDTAVAAKGLFAHDEMRMAVQSISGHASGAPSTSIFWMAAVAAFASIAYGGYSSFVGWNELTSAAKNRVAQSQEERVATLRKEKQDDVAVQDAFGSVNLVECFKWQFEQSKAEFERQEANHVAGLQRLEALRKPEIEDFSDNEKALLGAALLNARGPSKDLALMEREFAERADGPLPFPTNIAPVVPIDTASATSPKRPESWFWGLFRLTDRER